MRVKIYVVWQVAFLLEELGLSYETIYFDFKKGEQKSEEHTKLNPNGRIPTIIDHKNSDFTLWESNAILEYLAYTYDKEGKFTVSKPEEKYKQLQWLFFQSSGQGAYFGQAAWFKSFHAEKIPSAIERYQNEVKRVSGVLNNVLSKQEWLVGEKLTIADLSFIPWHYGAIKILDETDFSKEYPALDKWFKKMTARPAIKKVWDERNALNDA
ncbi:uncharacterized protein MELLADRAFT_40377 [Melampsora larici-populina 98AG31]|uniref:glutathione transferase n=1 Tax=Melampsora larici-populina (strain 98AG31 / pathotype 3-4-7) TaxID=747676 RepID=F4S838_MELLP|nr:uncharacterized protein MELLADRAFT_40377 [Melampsora larici-populina 98AG31]EGF99221.1 hypothetical protein MELLADRAFT_40377 [Melampsora larici-populina 98AG31]